MRSFAITSLILFVIFFAAGLYGVFVLSQDLAHEKTQRLFEKAGLTGAVFPAPEVRYGVIRYKNAPLDEEQFSTIKTLDIHYNPVNLLLSGEIQSVEISGINLTGELLPGGILTMAGWDDAAVHALNIKTLNIKRLEIRDARLSLLTPDLGGLNITFDLQARRQGARTELKGRLASRQKALGFTAGFSGHITRQGLWQSDFEIEQAKFELPNIKASRVAGTLRLSGQPSQPPQILSELRAGGFVLNGLPWQNASGTIQGIPGDVQIFAGAKSVGHQDLELGLNMRKRGKTLHDISGALHAPNLAVLVKYLATQDFLPLNRDVLKPLQNTAPVSLEFALGKDEESGKDQLNYNIKNIDKNIDINGKILINDQQNYSGEITSPAIFLTALDPSVFTAGTATLTGNFVRSDKNLAGEIRADIIGATYKAGPALIKDISGPLILKNPATLSMAEAQKFSCALPVTLKHKCTLSIEINKGRLNFTNFAANMLGGRFTIENFNPLPEGQQWIIDVESIDLWQVTEALALEGLTGTGFLNARIPVLKKDGRLFIQSGVIESDEPGIIRFIYKDPPSFFEGDEFELETIRMALENYHYDSLEVRIGGPLDGEADILIIARGHNPQLFEKRPVTLHLKTKARLMPLLENAIKKP